MTRCHYGGERPWFLCPSCGRRVAILYGGAVFACRHCYRLEARIANAENEATYLMAKVEIVVTYKLAGINRTRMEKLFHRLFAPARLDITINDRFGRPVHPEEWFLVPLFVIEEAVARIKDGSITGYIYDPSAAKLVKATGHSNA